MKLKILSLLAIAVMAISCGTPTTSTTSTTTTTEHQAFTDVPGTITATFTAQYPTAANVVWAPYEKVTVPIDWEMTGWPTLNAGDYVAQFDMDGQKYYAYYDANGDWIGSSSVLMDHNALPAPVRDLINTKYSGYAIEKVEREFDKTRTVYEIKLKKSDDDKVKLHVSDQGAILKEKLKD